MRKPNKVDRTAVGLRSSAAGVERYADDPAMSDPARFGFAATIVKPYRGDDLQQALQSLAARARH